MTDLIPGVLTQGGGVFGTFVSSFYLEFSLDGKRWYTYKELLSDAPPRAKVKDQTTQKRSNSFHSQINVSLLLLQVFLGNHDDRGVMESRLERMVSARFVRLLPHDFQNGIYLRLEIMGCDDGQQIDDNGVLLTLKKTDTFLWNIPLYLLSRLPQVNFPNPSFTSHSG